jgi:hypothetical protein
METDDHAERELMDDLVRILVAERGWEYEPYDRSPIYVDENEENPVVSSWPPGRLEDYRRAQAQRRELLEELKQRPELVAEVREKRALEAKIEALCRAKGLRFAPWECPPWWPDVDLYEDPAPGSDLFYGWAQSVPLAKKLRRKLIAEIEAGD